MNKEFEFSTSAFYYQNELNTLNTKHSFTFYNTLQLYISAINIYNYNN